MKATDASLETDGAKRKGSEDTLRWRRTTNEGSGLGKGRWEGEVGVVEITVRRTNGRKVARPDGRTDGPTHGRTDRRTAGRTNRRINEITNRRKESMRYL